MKFFFKIVGGSAKSRIFAAAKGYLARVVRDRSAKPGTAVRVRQVPPRSLLKERAFFVLVFFLLLQPNKQDLRPGSIIRALFVIAALIHGRHCGLDPQSPNQKGHPLE